MFLCFLQAYGEAQDKKVKGVTLVSLALRASRAYRVSLAPWDKKVKYSSFLTPQRIKLDEKGEKKILCSGKKVINFLKC